MSSTPCLLSVAFPFAPVGPAAVGGAEVILSRLDAALPSLGFESVVVAHAASQPTGKLYPVAIPDGAITDTARTQVEAEQQRQIDRALAENPVALIHMHGLDFDRYRIPAHLPVLVTLHLPPAWYRDTIWRLPGNYHFICVSESQRRACPVAVQHRLTVIGNGVPLAESTPQRAEGRYALMLARICQEKNLHIGLDAARLAGMPVMLAGETFAYEAHRRYFAEEIEPRLTGSGSGHAGRHPAERSRPEARFLGPVTGSAKTRLLARAACLLVPSLAPETSSLVAMEALAAGVPVIAMASGALPEIVADGYTGFLIPPGDDGGAAEAMAAAIRRLPTLDRRVCSEVAAERFALPRMLESYAKLYRALASKADLAQIRNPPVPQEQAGFAPPPLRNAAPVFIEELTEFAAMEGLVPEWSALWAEDPQATPFQHAAWLLPWWRQFGPEGTLQTLAAREICTRHLVGLLPLYVYAEPETRERKLLLLGAGTTDYLDGVWSAGHANAVAETLDKALCQRDVWDTAYLSQLRSGSALLLAARQKGLSVGPAEPAAALDLSADISADLPANPAAKLPAELPAKLRANIARYSRRAAALGALSFTVAAQADEALANFDQLLQFHEARWSQPGEPGVLSDPRVQAHHREAIPALHAAGLLRFFRLALNREVLGVLYALVDPPQRRQRSLYLYLIGFDIEAADLSPGTLLLHHVWEYAGAGGFSTLDFLRGGESYKQLWGAKSHDTFAVRFQA